jgi:putative tryptophan/tyrosine transport system substrate-binding protein
MTPMLTALILALAAIFTPARGGESGTEETAKGGGTAEQQIKTLEAQLMEAALKGDASSLEKYFADDYVAIHGDGKLGTKVQEIESFKSGTSKFESYDVHELKVRVYGDVAISNSLYFIKATSDGKQYSGDIRATRVWVRQKDNWKLVTHQATRVAPSTLAPAEVKQPAKIPRVGFLYPGLKSLSPMFDVFRRELAVLGYVEGQNIIIEPRFVEGQYERVPELAADLVHLKVDVIAVQGAVTVRPLKKVVKDTPIVFAIVVDPVAEDVVTNLERPGGNVTGVTTFDPQQPRKQLELLKEAIPGLKRVAFLGEQAIREDAIKAREEQAHALGLQTQRSRVAAPNPDLEGAFAAFRQGHADAVVVLEEPLVMNNRERISELAAKDRLPLMFPLSGEDAGGLIAYGTSFVEGYRRMAAYVDKVLKGAKPGELPVEAVNRYELVVNLKTAREIGVTIPPGVLKRADRVIQ